MDLLRRGFTWITKIGIARQEVSGGCQKGIDYIEVKQCKKGREAEVQTGILLLFHYSVHCHGHQVSDLELWRGREVGWDQLPALEDESGEPLGAARVMGKSDMGGVGASSNDNTGNTYCFNSDNTSRSDNSESMVHPRCGGLGYHSVHD